MDTLRLDIAMAYLTGILVAFSILGGCVVENSIEEVNQMLEVTWTSKVEDQSARYEVHSEGETWRWTLFINGEEAGIGVLKAKVTLRQVFEQFAESASATVWQDGDYSIFVKCAEKEEDVATASMTGNYQAVRTAIENSPLFLRLTNSVTRNVPKMYWFRGFGPGGEWASPSESK